MTRTPSRPQAKRTAAPASAAGKRSSWWPMLALAVALCSAAVVLFADESKALLRSVLAPPRHYKPDFPTHHVLDDIWTRDQVNELLALVKSQGSYLTAAKDLTSKVEHIGEAVPPLPDGKCPNRLLVPNQDHTLCILPSRIDIARHYFTHGGRASLRESFKRLSSRLQVFSGFVFMNLEADVLTPLFRSDKYIKASTDICHGDSIFDPIQLGIIITLPGQVCFFHVLFSWFFLFSPFDSNDQCFEPTGFVRYLFFACVWFADGCGPLGCAMVLGRHSVQHSSVAAHCNGAVQALVPSARPPDTRRGLLARVGEP
eukprot:m.452273 g.452273  ORF g.452273 m.452273 type:complete len:314 (+) comp56927_c0_seq1:82-1023(+)